jgi:hypothetical protein
MSDMYRFITIGAAALAAAAVPGTALAAAGGPSSTVKIPLVNDCGNGSLNGDCLSLDMVGTFAGVVKFRHKGNGDLRLMIQVKSAPHDQGYKLEIYCGQAAGKPGALIGELADALTTDAAGAAAGGPFEVPLADIRSACGSGNAVGHIQLVNVQAGSILDAAPIKMSAG